MRIISFKTSLCALVVAVALTACGKQDAPPPSMEVPVTIQEVNAGNVPVSFEYVGQTAGFKEVQVRAKVSGTLVRKFYQEGQQVSAGAPLFQIDGAPFQAAVEQARASVAMSQASLTQAQADFAKIAPLYNSQAVSKKEYDDASAAVQAAKASKQAAEATLKQAQINMGYTTVTAPISGYTSKETVSEGSYVTTTGLLTSISQLDPMYVNFSLSEPEIAQIRAMMESDKLKVEGRGGEGLGKFVVKLKLNDGTVFEGTGEVDFTDSVVDPATGSIKARALFNNKDKKILPGQFVRVLLEGGARPGMIAIPQTAILSTQQGKMVWVQGKDGVVEPRILKLGQESGNQVIVEEGLKAGDKLVTDNLMKIRPGTKVKHAPPQKPGQPAQKPAK